MWEAGWSKTELALVQKPAESLLRNRESLKSFTVAGHSAEVECSLSTTRIREIVGERKSQEKEGVMEKHGGRTEAGTLLWSRGKNQKFPETSNKCS